MRTVSCTRLSARLSLQNGTHKSSSHRSVKKQISSDGQIQNAIWIKLQLNHFSSIWLLEYSIRIHVSYLEILPLTRTSGRHFFQTLYIVWKRSIMAELQALHMHVHSALKVQCEINHELRLWRSVNRYVWQDQIPIFWRLCCFIRSTMR